MLRECFCVVVACCLVWSAEVHSQNQKPASTVGRIITVTGPINPEQLGQTSMHEHVFIDGRLPDESMERWRLAGRTRPLNATGVRLYNAPLTLGILGDVTLGRENRDNLLLSDEQVAIHELDDLRRVGGSAIVELTPPSQGRDPTALRRVSQATRLNIVMGTGWSEPAWYSADMDGRSIESLTDEATRDIRSGVGTTGVRAGIIGEVGIAGSPLSANEVKVIKAAARASRATGAAISLAINPRLDNHLAVLDLLQKEGADLRRVIVGHVDPFVDDPAFARRLLERGVTIQFDLLGRPTTVTRHRPTDTAVARAIVALLKAGHAEQIVLGHDVSTKVQLKAYGGYGYGFVAEYFLTFLKQEGATDAQITAMTVDNPRRLLALVESR